MARPTYPGCDCKGRGTCDLCQRIKTVVAKEGHLNRSTSRDRWDRDRKPHKLVTRNV